MGRRRKAATDEVKPAGSARALRDVRQMLKTGVFLRRHRAALRLAEVMLDRKVKREAAAERRRQRAADCPGQTTLWKEGGDGRRQESA